MYPISDEIHFLIGSLISIIGLIYLLSILGKKIYKKINYSKKYKVYKNIENDEGSISSNSIRYISEDLNGNILYEHKDSGFLSTVSLK